MTDEKQLLNVKYFNCLGSIIANDAGCTRKIKSRIVIVKTAVNRKSIFTSKLDFDLRKKLAKCYVLQHGSVWCWNVDTLRRSSETPEKFWNVVLEKDGEDQLDI